MAAKTPLPSDLLDQLSAADKKNGLPGGTMASIMQQEVGGQLDKYLTDPSAYHYGLNAEGKRVAGHTGKVSTAFGPFGILESTGRDPGYGVAPLKDKSLEEQIRFASEYLGARVKKDGLEAGLAGYGEGAKYGKQVASRLGAGAPAAAGVGRAVKTAIDPSLFDVPDLGGAEAPAPVQIAAAPRQYALPSITEWDALKEAMPQADALAAMTAYGQEAPGYASTLGSLASLASPEVDFSRFLPVKGKA